MDLNAYGVASGLVALAAVVLVTIVRQKRFELNDIGLFAATFLAALNIPPAFFLSGYALFPDPPAVETKLRHLERFVSFAGVLLLLLSLVAVWTFLTKAYQSSKQTNKSP